MSDQLVKLLAAYNSSKSEWVTTERDGNIDCDTEEYERFDLAEFSLISHLCTTLEEAHVKSRMFLNEPELMEAIATTRTPDGKKYLAVFIESLLPVDKSNNGENL